MRTVTINKHVFKDHTRYSLRKPNKPFNIGDIIRFISTDGIIHAVVVDNNTRGEDSHSCRGCVFQPLFRCPTYQSGLHAVCHNTTGWLSNIVFKSIDNVLEDL